MHNETENKKGSMSLSTKISKLENHVTKLKLELGFSQKYKSVETYFIN